MNTIVTFVINPVYRTLAFLPVLLGFVVHDIIRQPYKDSYLNTLQSLSSGCLVLVLGCNVVSSVSFMLDVTTIPLIYFAVDVLAIIEMILYGIVPVSLPLWLLYTLIKKKRNIQKKDE